MWLNFNWKASAPACIDFDSTRLTHICAKTPNNYWFGLWGVAWSVLNHYSGQCWNIFNSNSKKTFSEILRKYHNSHSRKCIWKYRCEVAAILLRPQCVKWNINRHGWWWHLVVMDNHFMMRSSNGKKNPRYWPRGAGNHRSPVNSSHKGQWRGPLMFSLICTWLSNLNSHCSDPYIWFTCEQNKTSIEFVHITS